MAFNGTGSNVTSLNASNIASGTLAVGRGGTGATTLNAAAVIIGNGTSAPTFVAPGTSGNALTSNGSAWISSVAPTPASLSTASGSAPSYSARAWVNFNGTGTVAIRASGNVSSITDDGVSEYTVNMTTAMPDVNYAAFVNGYRNTTGQGANFQITGQVYTTTQCRVVSGGIDCECINFAVFR